MKLIYSNVTLHVVFIFVGNEEISKATARIDFIKKEIARKNDQMILLSDKKISYEGRRALATNQQDFQSYSEMVKTIDSVISTLTSEINTLSAEL